MSAEQLVMYLTWIFYFGIFLVVRGRALREPRRSSINVALFFLLPALVIVTSTLSELDLFQQSTLLRWINGSLILGICTYCCGSSTTSRRYRGGSCEAARSALSC